MFAQTGGEEAKMPTGQVQPGRIDKHVKPLVAPVILVVNPSTRGFTRLSRQLPDLQSSLEKAYWHPALLTRPGGNQRLPDLRVSDGAPPATTARHALATNFNPLVVGSSPT